MIEDQLTHDERLRLECLAQAVQGGRMLDGPDDTVRSAKVYEAYVKGEQGADVG